MPPVLLSTEVKCWVSIFSLIESDWESYPQEEQEKRIYSLPEWTYRAACQHTDCSVFFGSSDPDVRPAMTITQIKEAKEICDSCPVFTECITHALRSREEYGVWAGTSGRTRSRIWKMVEEGIVTIDQVISDYKRGFTKKYESPRGEDVI